MKRTTILIAMMTLFVSTIMAQQVSVSEAMSRAKAYLQTNSPSLAKSKSATATTNLTLAYTAQSTTNQKTCFYIFNKGNDNGFIIVGGDETAQEILGYSDNGTFDYATAPDNFKWWLSQYQQQISSAIDYADANPQAFAIAKAKAKAARKTTVSRADISPLVTTSWDQVDPFNSAIPSLGSGYTGNYALATGCVATAMAQIMKYYNYPTTGVGSNSYTGINNLTFSADFANTEYDWDNMTNTYTSESTQTAKSAVATLMYHCGVSVNMNYGQIASGGSAASSENAAKAFTNHFRYNKSVRNEYRTYYTDNAWEQMIYNELANRRPVLYSGQTEDNAGHAFVCDGYQASGNKYHMNWGWGGNYNCYVVLTGTDAIKPGGTGTGGADDQDAYDQGQQAIINIIATEGGYESPELRNHSNTLTLNDGTKDITNYSHTHGSTKILTLTGNVWNLSRTLTQFTLGVKATNTTTGDVYYFPNSSPTSLASTGYSDYSLTFNANAIMDNGTYEIRMVGRNVNSTSNNDWYDVAMYATTTVPTVTVSGVTDPTKIPVSASISSTSLLKDQTAQISITDGYDGNVTYSTSPEGIVSISNTGEVTALAAGSTTITVNISGSSTYDSATETFNVTVEENGVYMRYQPYFNNDNNPYSGDMICYVPFYNSALESKSFSCFFKVQGPSGNTYTYSSYYNPTLPSQYNTTLRFDISSASSFFETEGFGQYTLYFYKDQDCTQPWNYPSVNFNYREALNHPYTLTDAKVGTLILPCDATIPTKDNSENSISWTAYECTGVVDNTLVLEQVTKLQRNTPYIIEGDAATYTFTGPIIIDSTDPSIYGTSALKGTVLDNTVSYQNGDFILQNNTSAGVAFYKVGSSYISNHKAKQYRAFIRTSSSNSTSTSYFAIPMINGGGTTTTINTTTAISRPTGIYSPNGIKIQRFQPGLNIIVDEQGNTHKVFITK